MPKYYAIQKAEKQADIYIFGDITSWPLLESDVSAYNVVQDIKDLDVDQIDVHINSYGGEVAEGWAMYNALKQHPAKVVTHGDGFVASAALYPFMAGDERLASTTSAYYFHHVISGGYGYADELRKVADDAEKLNEIGRQAFTTNTDLTDEEVKALEDDETWLSPQEAFEMGIATSLVNERQNVSATQSIRKEIMQRIFAKDKPQPLQGQQQKEKPEYSIMNMLAGLKF